MIEKEKPIATKQILDVVFRRNDGHVDTSRVQQFVKLGTVEEWGFTGRRLLRRELVMGMHASSGTDIPGRAWFAIVHAAPDPQVLPACSSIRNRDGFRKN